jgi:hypothetical protein
LKSAPSLPLASTNGCGSIGCFLAAALEDHFRSIVERAFRRRTLGFLGGIDTGRDVTVDVFTLEPEATKANNHDQVTGHGRSAADQAATRSHGSTQR